MKRDTMLLCTFLNSNKFIKARTINNITNNFNVLGEIFVFKNKNDDDKIIMTYNVERRENMKFIHSTFQIHRNKETNTLYTLNALNALVRQESGITEQANQKNFRVNWANYKNSLILMQTPQGEINENKEKQLSIIELELLDVLSVNVRQ